MKSDNYIHIVIGDAFAGTLRQALKELGLEKAQKIITLWDNYAIGPMSDMDSSEGREKRSLWFRENITEAFEDYFKFEEEYQELLHQFCLIPESTKVIVWTGCNALEQTGMGHAVHLLHGKGNPLLVCDGWAACKESDNKTADCIYDFGCSGMIQMNKLCEILKDMDNNSRRLDSDDVLRIEKEWQKISEEAGVLRIWQNGEVLNVTADYCDDCLLKRLEELQPLSDDNGFVKSARVIGETIGHCNQSIGDSYLEYRLREMIYAGVLEIKGVPAAMRYYSIRRK